MERAIMEERLPRALRAACFMLQDREGHIAEIAVIELTAQRLEQLGEEAAVRDDQQSRVRLLAPPFLDEGQASCPHGVIALLTGIGLAPVLSPSSEALLRSRAFDFAE